MFELYPQKRSKCPAPGWCCKCEEIPKENVIWQCHCYEDVKQYDWRWQNEDDGSVAFSNEDRDVFFHPFYSSGTAVVRGNTPLKKNRHYYWEIKVLSNLYGTDVMVGVGTTDMVVTNERLQFCSLLGLNSQSWGYSYDGTIQHNRMRRMYGRRFDKGSIIGVHLNMCEGTLEYYLNRCRLGVAFKDLKKHELYPMMCSTAAKSAARLCCAVTEKPSLQLLCLQVIRNNPELNEQFNNIPGLKRTFEKRYFWIMSKEIQVNNDKVGKRTLPLEALLREKRPLLLDEARADPDHISYREILGKKVKTGRTIKKSGARHHSVKLNSPFEFVYCSDTESEEESEEEDEYVYYCVNCNIRLNDGSNTHPLCLTCILAM